MFGGEAHGVAEVLRAPLLCAEAGRSTQWRRETMERTVNAGEGKDLPPLLYLLGKGGRRFRIDRATISAERGGNCRTVGCTI